MLFNYLRRLITFFFPFPKLINLEGGLAGLPKKGNHRMATCSIDFQVKYVRALVADHIMILLALNTIFNINFGMQNPPITLQKVRRYPYLSRIVDVESWQ